MKKYEAIYNKLKEQYTDEEIAESMLIPKDMTAAERQQSNEEIRAFRFKLLKERSEEQRIFAELLRFKFLMEDYIKNEPYNLEKSFGKHLTEYVQILNRTKKQLSIELAIHYTKISRIINDREEPNVALMYRLEKHSGGIIPALYWWRLVSKKQEAIIRQDLETRKLEGAKVSNAMEYVG